MAGIKFTPGSIYAVPGHSLPGYSPPELPKDEYAAHRDAPALNPAEIVIRLLNDGPFLVHAFEERWGEFHDPILHIAVMNTKTKLIVRFEEDLQKFPSHQLIDKLRVLAE